jgi:hypothetical protein
VICRLLKPRLGVFGLARWIKSSRGLVEERYGASRLVLSARQLIQPRWLRHEDTRPSASGFLQQTVVLARWAGTGGGASPEIGNN